MTDYERYQLQWMIDHDFSIRDLIRGLEEFQGTENISDTFSEWERDYGFGNGSIWACEAEWESCEPKTFGRVQWCDEDIVYALDEHDFDTGEYNVAMVREMCKHHFFTDNMIASGWNCIHAYIQGLSDKFGAVKVPEKADDSSENYDGDINELFM